MEMTAEQREALEKDFAEAQRLLREGDTEKLAEWLSRDVEERAAQAHASSVRRFCDE